MRYFRSSSSFRQYREKQGSWSKFKKFKCSSRRRETDITWRDSIPAKREGPSRHLVFIRRSILPGILAVWAGLLIYLPYFRITKINYSGLQIIKPSEMEQTIKQDYLKTSYLWPANNYFFVNGRSLANVLQKKFSLNEILVTKVFPDTLNIDIEEKVSSVIYDDGKDYFLLDQEGQAIRELRPVNANEYAIEKVSAAAASSSAGVVLAATSSTARRVGIGAAVSTTVELVHIPDYNGLKTSYGDFPIVYGASATSSAGKQPYLVKPSIIQGLITAYKIIRRAGLGWVNYFALDDPPEAGVTIHTNQPWQINLQAEASIDQQISNVETILRSGRPSSYIDVRFGQRVFWK